MPLLRSWVESANAPGHPFPLNNLPCGVFSLGGAEPRCGVAIGDMIADCAGMEAAGVLRLADDPLIDVPFWNEVMEAGPAVWARLRAALTGMLAEGAARGSVERFLVPQAGAVMHLPFLVSEYTDFYAGRHHAENVGTMMRGAESALPPNWLHMPIGYNGRASSVVVSGTDVRRPWGQVKAEGGPVFTPTRRFDFELELGAVVGTASNGPVTVAGAEAMIFGYVLLNDWSARDIQAWEYQPLGPFQSKATATSISPWIVMAAALAPFRVAPPGREVALLPHLADTGPAAFNIDLSVTLTPPGGAETVITRTNARELYYTFPQQLAHHTACGCPMTVGDLLGSGTISGPERTNLGSLLELSWGGKDPVTLDGGETRNFLEDGDVLTLTGSARGDGFSIGFGTCTGRVLPALTEPYARQPMNSEA